MLAGGAGLAAMPLSGSRSISWSVPTPTFPPDRLLTFDASRYTAAFPKLAILP